MACNLSYHIPGASAGGRIELIKGAGIIKESVNKDKHLKMGVCAFLAVATYILYCQVVNFDFISMDTPAYVYNNQHVKSGLNPESVKWAFNSTELGNWHPVTWLSHMLDVELWGLNPGAHHHTSIIIHIVNTTLLFLFISTATGYIWRSALVTALFALHPLHVESSYGWRKEKMFYALSFFSYPCCHTANLFQTAVLSGIWLL